MEQIYKVQDPTGKIIEISGPPGASDDEVIAQAQKLFSAPKETPKKTGDIVSSSIIRGASGLAGLPVDALNLLRTARNKAQGTNYPGFPGGSQDIIKGVEKVTGMPLYQPESGAGSVLGGAIEGATAGAPFGPLGMISGGVGGATAELAGLATNNNPFARFMGGLVGSGVTGLLGSARRPTGNVLGDALKETSDDQFKLAQNLVDEARKRGITLTGPEALAQVKNSPNEPVLNLLRVVEQSRGGGPQMSQVMSQRTDQNRQAIQPVLNQIGPKVQDPTSIAPRVSSAAEGVINDARNVGNAAARPFYQQAEKDMVSGRGMDALLQDPVVKDAVESVLKDPFYGVVGKPRNSVEVLDAAKKYLDDIASGAKASGLNNKSRIAGQSTKAITETADAVSPAYPQARSIVEKNMREVVEPLQASPVGGLAAKTDFTQQRNVLFPKNPETLTPDLVKSTISQLNKKDPTAARDLTRQFLETQFDEASRNLVKGGNEWGGAKFASAITGNSTQAKNIRAAVESVGGKDALTGFNKFIQIMEAQGKRQPTGSQTAFNQQVTEELSKGGAMSEVVTSVASPSKGLSAVSDWWQRFKYEGNSKELAQIFTDPQSVAKMRKLALMGKDSPGARALATSIVVPLTQTEQ